MKRVDTQSSVPSGRRTRLEIRIEIPVHHIKPMVCRDRAYNSWLRPVLLQLTYTATDQTDTWDVTWRVGGEALTGKQHPTGHNAFVGSQFYARAEWPEWITDEAAKHQPSPAVLAVLSAVPAENPTAGTPQSSRLLLLPAALLRWARLRHRRAVSPHRGT
ncbi:hypothetical protein GCM10009733_020820 [Nonomuraea maheshkhaliensis]|uniref:Uncharacterized protein n=1 Tax=Nonomuraea maheshkhaliensis TaxID=419590 RepID=A0ABN2F2F2_9ACTN